MVLPILFFSGLPDSPALVHPGELLLLTPGMFPLVMWGDFDWHFIASPGDQFVTNKTLHTHTYNTHGEYLGL